MSEIDAKGNGEYFFLNFSIEDWLSGKFIILQSIRHYSSHLIEAIPKCTFDKLNIEVQGLIKAEQKKIFKSQIEIHSERVIKKAQELLSNSMKPEALKNNTIARLNKLFEGKYKGDSIFYSSDDSEFIFDHWTYQYMVDHYNNFYVGGKSYDYADVPSPGLIQFQIEPIQPEVQVYVLQNLLSFFVQWDVELSKNEILSPPLNKPTDEKASVENMNFEDAFGYKYDDLAKKIFLNEESFKIFCKFEKEHIIRNPKKADYYSIFNLFSENSELMLPDVSNALFCFFLSETNRIEMMPSEMKSRTQGKATLRYEMYFPKKKKS